MSSAGDGQQNDAATSRCLRLLAAYECGRYSISRQAMKRSITRRYHFESAHWLPKVPEWHKCRRLHGHNYQIEVTVEATLDERGFILDFFELDAVILPLVEQIDHRVLNDIEGLENPTAELIAEWFLKRIPAIRVDSPAQEEYKTLWVSAIRVYETSECWCDAIRSR
jgi:6-pyruvoyltetrahydropterin/6-carboxytetrahydropterin synthase